MPCCCCCKVDSGPFVKVFAVAKNKPILNVKIGLSSLLTFQSLKNINGNINDKKYVLNWVLEIV